MKKQWMLINKRIDFERFSKKFGINPVLVRLIRNKDMETEEDFELFLHGTMKDIPSPHMLPQMDKAVQAIFTHREGRIRIIGDYDIDGVCSTTILVKGLRALGMQVDYAIPHRVLDGYGLNERLIEEAVEDGTKLVVTCDNGIAAVKQVEYANAHGLSMVITDHHEVPYEENEEGEKHYILPSALAVVDPKMEESKYPYSGICGAVVAFQVIRAVWEEGHRRGCVIESEKELFDELVELAAFATIGDVMELRYENRILVKVGMEAMEHSSNLGLRALIAACGLEGKKITPYTVGFVLGPCMNATGRLDSAQRAMELLLSTDYAKALELAQDLKGMNDSRKDLTLKGTQKATELVESMDLSQNPVLVLYLPDCHESLAGIIAGRIREHFGHPTFVLTDGEEGVKGSGRSIEAYSMYEELSKCKELLTKFGGHKMAAGVSLRKEDVEIFRDRLNANSTLTEADFVEKVYIDLAMPMSYASKELVKQMELLEPYGNGNSKPVFAQKNVTFLSVKQVGRTNRVLKCIVKDEQGKYPVTIFSEHEIFDAYIEEHFGKKAIEDLYAEKGNVVMSVLYYPEINNYMGREELQIIVTGYQA